MNALLDQSRPTRGRRPMSVLCPPTPVRLPAISRPSLGTLQATFGWIYCIGPDASVTLPCAFRIGRPVFSERVRQGEKTLAQAIDDRFLHARPAVLGIQHAWELCRTQRDIPFLRLPGMLRIWFYGVAAYNDAGGEFRPALVRDNDGLPWKTDMVPWCLYSEGTDCLALAQL